MLPGPVDPEIEAWIRAAEWAGRHALPLFLAGWVLLMAGCWLAWWAVRRHAAARIEAAATPLVRLFAGIVLGFGVIVAGSWIFAELADEIDPDEDLGHIDHAFTDSVAVSTPAAAIRFFSVITHLGDPVTLTALSFLVVLALAIRGWRWLAVAWGASMGGAALLVAVLKAIFERVRPAHDATVVIAEDYSFPSGHSTGAIVFYGLLACLSLRFLPQRWHLPALLAAASLAYLIGSSRIFLRAHFVSDVVAGFALGAAWLAVCITCMVLTRVVYRPCQKLSRTFSQ